MKNRSLIWISFFLLKSHLISEKPNQIPNNKTSICVATRSRFEEGYVTDQYVGLDQQPMRCNI